MYRFRLLCAVVACTISLITSPPVHAASILAENFIGYTGLNTAPAGWTTFTAGATTGVDSSQSAWWQGLSGIKDPYSPDGDIYYVRAAIIDYGGATEGLEIDLTGLTIGQAYDIEFYSSASNVFHSDGYTVGDAWWELFLDGSSIGLSATGTVNPTALIWNSNLITFVATSEIHTLGFQGRTAGTEEIGNALLDGVTANVSTIPLPGAVWLLGSALFGLGVIKRKRA